MTCDGALLRHDNETTVVKSLKAADKNSYKMSASVETVTVDTARDSRAKTLKLQWFYANRNTQTYVP